MVSYLGMRPCSSRSRFRSSQCARSFPIRLKQCGLCALAHDLDVLLVAEFEQSALKRSTPRQVRFRVVLGVPTCGDLLIHQAALELQEDAALDYLPLDDVRLSAAVL